MAWYCTATIIGLLAAVFGHLTSAATDLQQLPLTPEAVPGFSIPPASSETLEFRLSSIFHHGTYRYPGLHRRKIVSRDTPVWAFDDVNGSREPLRKLEASTRPLRIKRLADRSPNRIESLLANARFTGAPVDLPHSAWTTEEVPAPNVTDKKTLLTLARIAGNSYVEVPNTGEWEDVKGGFNYTEDFGWENDGLRGHIFADENNQTVVIGLKGTSTAVFDGVGSTTNDKINDNLFFSCCCGEGTSWWSKQVCDCQTATYTCNSTCVSKALREKNRYYYAAQELYYNVTALYPNAQVWLVGHSLGGSTSSLLAKTVGQPAVTFEAPGEAMAAKRLGLPTPPGYNLSTQDVHRTSSGVFHFGHTADPLFMGTCNGANSLCSLGGYAMESVCHTGFECVYDTMADRSWGSHLSKHRIQTVIHEVIEEYNETAECKELRADVNFFRVNDFFHADEDGDLSYAWMVGLLG